MKKKRSATHRPGGMTLIELLTVLAIIGILAGLILPALNSSREKGRLAFCANNLRNIGQAIQYYIDEHDEYYPSGIGNASLERWDLAILPYLNESTDIFLCPSDRLRESGETNAPRTYAANAGRGSVGPAGRYPFGKQAGTPLRMLDMDNAPGDIILVGERPADRNTDGEYDLSSSRGYVGGTDFLTLTDAGEAIHAGSVHRRNRGANYLFTSGAVRYVTTNDIAYSVETNYWTIP